MALTACNAERPTARADLARKCDQLGGELIYTPWTDTLACEFEQGA